jgi:hypothetical protein
MAKITDTSTWKVMPARCATCPFNADGVREIREMVARRCLTEVSQICHHPRLHGKKETTLCRGARDLQLEVFAACGFIEAATDEAWDKKRKELGV